MAALNQTYAHHCREIYFLTNILQTRCTLELTQLLLIYGQFEKPKYAKKQSITLILEFLLSSKLLIGSFESI